MAQQTIGIGSSADDGTGDSLRTAGGKINSNFTELYNAALPSAGVAANRVYAGPSTGANAAPTFRALVAGDIPSLAWSKITSGTPTTLSGYGITDAYTTTQVDTLLSSYLTASAAALAYQPIDSDLTSWAAVTRASGFDAFAATPSSANLRALLTDEAGTGALYFVGGALGTPASATLTNATGLPIAGISATGTPSASTYLRGDGTWATIASGGSPGGSSGQVQYNNAGSFGGVSGITLASGALSALSVTGGTVTSSTPIFDATQTWNSGATTFTGLKLNVTDTASASASLLMDLQVGGSSKLSVSKAGVATFSNDLIGTYFYVKNGGNSTAVVANTDGTGPLIGASASGKIGFFSGSTFGGALDTILTRDAANTLALRNATNAQAFNWYFSYTDASNYTRGALKTSSGVVEVAAESAGTGTANIDLKLTTKGTGVVQYGTHSAIAGETVTGYITIKDAGGTTRKLAVVS